MIDIDKFICSLLDAKKDEGGIPLITYSTLLGALKDQGVEYKDGEIQRIPLTEEQKAYIEEDLKNGSIAKESDLVYSDDKHKRRVYFQNLKTNDIIFSTPKWRHICSFQSFSDNDIFIEGNNLRWGNRVISLDELKKLPKER